jgi:hypothetical protein
MVDLSIIPKRKPEFGPVLALGESKSDLSRSEVQHNQRARVLVRACVCKNLFVLRREDVEVAVNLGRERVSLNTT